MSREEGSAAAKATTVLPGTPSTARPSMADTLGDGVQGGEGQRGEEGLQMEGKRQWEVKILCQDSGGRKMVV